MEYPLQALRLAVGEGVGVYRDMELWTEVRRKVLAGEMSKRAACRKYKLHWDTLEKMLGCVEPPGYSGAKPRPKPVLEKFLPLIREILEQDRNAPPKQRHTAKRIYDRLKAEHGFPGSYSTVKEAVRELKTAQKEVFVPLSHPPAHAQVDFGEATVVIDGESAKVALFVMTLVYSDAVFIQTFPRECTETFQEGHRRAFEFFGGVPKRISYDNSKIAVAKVVGRRGRTPTREFLRLQSHYLFDHHFCRVRRANEKGHVENLLGFARRNFLVPIPHIQNLTALNESLLSQCRKDRKRTLRGKSCCKEELLQQESSQFLPLPSETFEARRIETPTANSESLARFDRNDYSVPTEFAHRRLTAIGGIDQVRLWAGDQLVASHARCWEKAQALFDPRHYLALLERKPGAFDHAKPLEHWDLPACFELLRRRQEAELGSRGDGTREFIKVLRLLESATLAQLTRAVERSLSIGATTADAVRLMLQCEREEPVRWFRLDGRPQLAAVQIPPPKLQDYTTLLATELETATLNEVNDAASANSMNGAKGGDE